jgi:hypothetical protein
MKERIDLDISKGLATKAKQPISFLNQSHPKKQVLL